jgi:predicted transposase YbfD/YdcC
MEKSDLSELFSRIPDPRIGENFRYPLNEIIFLTIAANLSGVESWRGIELFGVERLDSLRNYFPFVFGIPSRLTLSRVFSLINPIYFESFLREVAQCIEPFKNNKVIAIDGKTLRGTANCRKTPFHMLNAVAVDSGISFGQVLCPENGNENSAMPYLLDSLDLKGATITADAAHCQHTTAQKIIEKKADFVLAIKRNQKALYDAAEQIFEDSGLTPEDTTRYAESIDKGHGRLEYRRYQVAYLTEPLQKVWKEASSIAMVVSEVTRNGVTTSQVRYFISSMLPDPQRLAHAIRGHWSVENRLHWTLDVVFEEDRSLKRKDHAPRNFAALRKIVMNTIRGFLGNTQGVKHARMKAAWNPTYMTELLDYLASKV